MWRNLVDAQISKIWMCEFKSHHEYQLFSKSLWKCGREAYCDSLENCWWLRTNHPWVQISPLPPNKKNIYFLNRYFFINNIIGWCAENRTQINRLKVYYFTIKLYTNKTGYYNRTWTCNQHLIKMMLYQLSYVVIKLAVVVGFEPTMCDSKSHALDLTRRHHSIKIKSLKN